MHIGGLMKITRRFTTAGTSPYDSIEFRRAISEIKNPDGSVVFRLDGRKLRTVKATKRATVKVAVARLKTGTHKLTARVTFSDGTKAKTLTLRFSKCANTASPHFTG